MTTRDSRKNFGVASAMSLFYGLLVFSSTSKLVPGSYFGGTQFIAQAGMTLPLKSLLLSTVWDELLSVLGILSSLFAVSSVYTSLLSADDSNIV